MTDSSILNDTKKALGIADDYTAFDLDIVMHINTVFSTLQQLGIGPDDGFEITDATDMWDTFLEGDKRYNQIKTYMYLRVRMLFDPPATSFHLNSMEKQIGEFEWRIREIREETEWVDPNPPTPVWEWC